MTTDDKSLKRNKIIYWIITVLIALAEAVPSAVFFNSPMAKAGTQHLGFPEYFRIELSIGKIIGGIILLIPMMPARLKEWAYVAFGISCISASIANYSVDGPSTAVAPLIMLILFIISYSLFHKIRKQEGLEN
jgi:hypothetical protein